MSSQQNSNNKVKLNCEYSKEGLGLTISALFNGMEGLLSSKTVVGEPIEAGGVLIIPLIEVSAGLATGALINSGKNNGAGAMNTKVSPVALLIIQDGKTRLVTLKEQDVFTKLLDLIPEAIDKIKKGSVSKEIVKQAEEAYKTGTVEIVEPEPGKAAEAASKPETIAETAAEPEAAAEAGSEAGLLT